MNDCFIGNSIRNVSLNDCLLQFLFSDYDNKHMAHFVADRYADYSGVDKRKILAFIRKNIKHIK